MAISLGIYPIFRQTQIRYEKILNFNWKKKKATGKKLTKSMATGKSIVKYRNLRKYSSIPTGYQKHQKQKHL